MSSPAQAGPSAMKEKKDKPLNRVLTRAKTVIKKVTERGTDASRRLSFLQPKEKGESSKAAGKKPAAAVAAAEPEVPEGVVKVAKLELFEERAKKLGERYGLELKPGELYATEGHALRVEKPIRMRIHRICHRCNTPFGSAKECPSCHHAKCAKCARYPPKRTDEEKEASRAKRAAAAKAAAEDPPIQPDWGYTGKVPPLTKPSKTGGQDLVLKKPRQRVRRTCHECGTLFISGSKTCASCQHVRCTDCPRDPSKKDRYPYGYPGDVFGPNSVPHHTCHECKTKFPPGAANDTPCSKCSHPKCDLCPRLTPRKVDPEPSEEILKAVQEKMASMSVK